MTEDTLDRLNRDLAARAAAEGLLDVAYRELDTSIGTLLIAATKKGVVRLAFSVEGHDHVLAELTDQISPRVLHAPARLDRAAREVEQYLDGTRRSFDLPLDLALARGFRRTVLHHLQAVEYGTSTSYAALAEAAGSPRAVRAVGTACARNPLPLLIPCHRVLRSDGSLGGYRGGPEVKALLLQLEREQ